MKKGLREFEAGSDLKEEGIHIFEVGKFKAFLEFHKPRTVIMGESGKCPDEEVGRLMDWMQETITKARGL